MAFKDWHMQELPWCIELFITFLQILGIVFADSN